jgi:membrane peptidoglycan carboxypeptidase
VRTLLRLVIAVAFGTAAVAGVAVTVPSVVRAVYRHGATTVEEPLPPLSSSTEEGSTVYADDGTTVLAVLRASRTQKPVPLADVAPVLIHAVLDTEDERFYQHGGIDLPSTLRAFFNDSAGNNLQGGSTITQQLVKNVYLSTARKLSRKIREAIIANRLEKLYTKSQILQAYLNTIYLGSSAYGVEAAAEAYWREPASKVTLPEAALLAGLIQAPSGDDPIAYPDAARVRRTEVLGRMLHYKTITAAQYASANAAPLPTSASIKQVPLSGPDGYYVAQVESELLGPSSPLGSDYAERREALFEGGLKVYTNLDPTAEAQAAQAVTTVTPANNQGFVENLVALAPATGNVRALYAGPDYAANAGYDVATEGLRQPGSGFKLFTLLASLEQGGSIFDEVDGTSPCAIPFPDDDDFVKDPAHNDEGDGQSGVTTVLNATAQSLNCAYLRMAHEVGLPAVVAMAEKLGIPNTELAKLADFPSIVLGAAGVEPIQMAAAYATLASGGVYHAPQFVNRVLDLTGQTIFAEDTKGVDVLSPTIVAEADAAFQAVVQYGTGTAAQQYDRPVAGKTGTNNGPTDAWFNGYTPQLETTVWMGNPSNETTPMIIDYREVYGGTFPAETVHAFMAADLANQPVLDFPTVDDAELPPPMFVPEVTGATPPYGVKTPYGESPPTVAPVPTYPPGGTTAPTAPVATTPTPTTPIGTAPVATTPVVTTPATTPPVSTPAATTPVTSP